MKKLASIIAAKEGKKRQTPIGDIREILSALADIEIEKPGFVFSELAKAVQKKVQSK
jgi:predicted transcriptional regulator